MFWYWFFVCMGISLILTLLDHILLYIVWILRSEKGKTLGDFYDWIEYNQSWFYVAVLWIPIGNFICFLLILLLYYIAGGCSYLFSKFENLRIR